MSEETVAPPRPKRKRKANPTNPYGFTNPHVLKALAYIDDVITERVPACKWTRLACERQLRDLEGWRTDPAYPFAFDESLAGRACEFFELLPHTQGSAFAFRRDDGSWNTLVLGAWQCFTETTLYGWVRKDTKGRRFLRSYEEIPRGNGKSFKLSGALLYSFTEGEQGVEAYSAAVDREQAAKVYGEAEAMIYKRPDLATELGLETSAHAIFQKATHSYAKALSREAKKTGDGKNIYFAAVDEFHAHPTRDVWGILDTGTGKRAPTSGRGPLIRIITTAGFNTSGVCFEKRNYAKKILEQSAQDETWFAIIYTVDDADDWTDEACRQACSDHSHPGCVWRKANPNWGVSVDPVDFTAKAMAAIQLPSAQSEFLTKHLNVWCSSGRQWIAGKTWDRLADPDLSPEDFAGSPCFFGLDLGTKSDITAKVKLFLRDEERPPREGEDGPASERHYYLFLDSYLPEAAILDSRNAQYGGWVREGRIVTTPGDVVDFGYVRDEIIADARKYHPHEVPFDPWNATQVTTELQAEGLPMVDYAPHVKHISPAMKEFADLVHAGRLHHDANPVMRWMLMNVVVQEDRKGNIFPRKETRENKIDGVFAALTALARAMLWDGSASGSYLDSGDLLVL